MTLYSKNFAIVHQSGGLNLPPKSIPFQYHTERSLPRRNPVAVFPATRHSQTLGCSRLLKMGLMLWSSTYGGFLSHRGTLKSSISRWDFWLPSSYGGTTIYGKPHMWIYLWNLVENRDLPLKDGEHLGFTMILAMNDGEQWCFTLPSYSRFWGLTIKTVVYYGLTILTRWYIAQYVLKPSIKLT